MEISFHLRCVDDAPSTSYLTKSAGRLAKAAEHEVAFENSRALTVALSNTPQVREDFVCRARELVGDVNYPPSDTIWQIAQLLAIQMHTEGE